VIPIGVKERPLDKKFSVILPVLNEAAIINSMMDHLEALVGSDQCEIIVVDGSPDGSTIKAITRRGIYCVKSPQGRARQMNAGAAAAKGELLIFLHADTRLPRNALDLINQIMTQQIMTQQTMAQQAMTQQTITQQTMAQQALVGGAFDLRIGSERPMLKIISRIASLRSRLTRIPYGDQAIFIRRDYFNQIGRYPEIPLMEDVALMRRIKKAGGRIGFIPEPVITSARRWEKEGILYVTARNWVLLSAYFLGVSPEKLAKYYSGGATL
jgi:glycosyltransferase involved in cell wall biosynthesis